MAPPRAPNTAFAWPHFVPAVRRPRRRSRGGEERRPNVTASESGSETDISSTTSSDGDASFCFDHSDEEELFGNVAPRRQPTARHGQETRLNRRRRVEPAQLSGIILIAGGMGPAAGARLQNSIVRETSASGDADHLPIIHVSAPACVADRTEYLLSGGDDGDESANPGSQVASLLQTFASVVHQDKVVIGVPCNTFHAPPIFDVFCEAFAKDPRVVIVHMLEETVDHITLKYPDARRIGLMSTTGTRRSRVYHDLFEARGLEVVEVPEGEAQEELHETIYDRDQGLKAVTPASEFARERFSKYAETLERLGAQCVVLGCTEIPLAFIGQTHSSGGGLPLIDPVTVLARALVRQTASNRLRDDSSDSL